MAMLEGGEMITENLVIWGGRRTVIEEDGMIGIVSGIEDIETTGVDQVPLDRLIVVTFLNVIKLERKTRRRRKARYHLKYTHLCLLALLHLQLSLCLRQQPCLPL